jgi:hypothetical protein
MDGTASLANREIGRVLPANYRKVPFSGAVEHLNKAATARYFGLSLLKTLSEQKSQQAREASETCRDEPTRTAA